MKLALLTDGMFSNDGSTAPLRDYLKVLPNDAMILVDDAHGAGVLGKTGKGSLEYTGVSRRRIIQTITLSKAFGAYGGAILGRSSLRARIFARSSIFKASTPLPLPIAHSVSRSLRLLKTDRSLKQRLARNVAYVRTALRKAGVPFPQTPGPILAVLPRSKSEVPLLSKKLLAAKIYPPFIRYANGPDTGYFRFMISSEHTQAQLDQLVKVLSGFRLN